MDKKENWGVGEGVWSDKIDQNGFGIKVAKFGRFFLDRVWLFPRVISELLSVAWGELNY